MSYLTIKNTTDGAISFRGYGDQSDFEISYPYVEVEYSDQDTSNWNIWAPPIGTFEQASGNFVLFPKQEGLFKVKLFRPIFESAN
ncbi:MAG: hypothetical protein P8X74_13515 [Reinekea sp.]